MSEPLITDTLFLKPPHCPVCDGEMTGVFGVEPRTNTAVRPREGDPMLCGECGALLVFGPQMALSIPTPDQAAALLYMYPMIARMQPELIKLIKSRKRKK